MNAISWLYSLDNSTDNIWGEPTVCQAVRVLQTFTLHFHIHQAREGILFPNFTNEETEAQGGGSKVPRLTKLLNGSPGIRTQICPESLLSAPGLPFTSLGADVCRIRIKSPPSQDCLLDHPAGTWHTGVV